MSGIWRVSDGALSGAAAGAGSGTVPVFNTSSGRAAPATPKFDAKLSVYNFSTTSLGRFRAAVARSRNGGAVCKISCIGDSITAGDQSTAPWAQNSYPYRLATLLGTRYGTVKTGIAYAFDATRRDALLTVGAGVGTGSGQGPLSIGTWSVTNGGTATIDYGPVTCDRFTVYYTQFSGGGSFTISEGGTTLATQTTTGSNLVGSVTVSVTAGSHTFRVTGTSGTIAYIQGVEAWTSTDGGIRITAVGKGGAAAAAMGGTGGGWSGMDALYGTNVAPDLSLIYFGANDAQSSVTITSYKASLQTAITAAKAANGDVILIAQHDNAYAALGSTGGPAPYVQALYDLADLNDVALIDMYRRWPSYAVAGAAPYSLLADNVHPNSKGYWDMTQTIASALQSAA